MVRRPEGDGDQHPDAPRRFMLYNPSSSSQQSATRDGETIASQPSFSTVSPGANQRLDSRSPAYPRASPASTGAAQDYDRSYTELSGTQNRPLGPDHPQMRSSPGGRDEEGRIPASWPPVTAAGDHRGGRETGDGHASRNHTLASSSGDTTKTGGDFKMLVKPKHKKSAWRRAGESMNQSLGKAYKKVIIEGILRQKPLPKSKDGRHIPITPGDHPPARLIDERTGRPFINNFIRSSRYTLWNFVPKQLVFQFSKLANFYFLVMGILQVIPGLSTTGRYTTIGPLAVFVAFSMAKEGWDDYRRYVRDKAENRSDAWVLGSGRETRGKKKAGKSTTSSSSAKRRPDKLRRQNSPPDATHEVEMGHYSGLDSISGSPVEEDWTRIQWQDIRVGDIIRLQRDDNVPADIVLLHATGPNQVAYIETMALDGETNLKSKQSCPLLGGRCSSVQGLKTCQAEIVSEDPNQDLYSYDGKVIVDRKTLPVTLNNVVYRGSTMRNTTEAYGLVLNSGEECKIRMNAHKDVRAKSPKIQRRLNKIVIWLVFVVVGLSAGLTAGYFIWRDEMEKLLWYLMKDTLTFKEVFIAFLLMFNTLIPLSLYISLEIIKIGQLYLLGDVEMYDPVSNTAMDANTMTILEDLGQVSYVFSDKTGTLTENMMRFRKMSVAGTAWLHDMDIKRDEAEKQRKIAMSRKKVGKKKKEGLSPVVRERGMEGMGNSIQMDDLERPADLEKTAAISEPMFSAQNRYPELKTERLLQYVRERPNTTFARKTRHFLMCMALCNTCLPEIKENGEIEYQASSPDELALVEAARDLGYEMIDRPAQFIKLRFPDENGRPVVETFEVLDVIEFTSKRKRMSIIIRMPDNSICVFCKGADSALLPRLKLSHLAMQKQRQIERQASKRRSQEQETVIRRRSLVGTPRTSLTLGRTLSGHAPRRTETVRSDDFDFDIQPRMSSAGDKDSYSPVSPRASAAFSQDNLDAFIDDSVAVNEGTVFERCFQHTDDFATDGLRTLLFASRYLEEDEYRRWKKIYHEATTSLNERQSRIEAAGELIETKFDLAGATAIEDKLQDGVPDTIDKLRRANIKVWMLTGDKRETAINIGHSAKVCKPYSEIYVLDSEADESLMDKLTVTLNEVARGMVPHSVVVIDGGTLACVDADENLSTVFYELVVRVDSVICCRASPSQKAHLVKKIRHGVPQSMTLAIGDGANDISMILAAQVGIGISGREGLQAARSADFSIAQFRFLQRLLFVHGRWNYMRTGKYILATFWKEIFFFTVQAHYQPWNGYTGTSLYENWSLTVFNGVFTSIPVWILGILDRDLKASTLLKFPELYRFGQQEKGFNFRMYLGWSFIGAIEAAIMFYAVWAVYRELPFDQDTSLYAMGSVNFTVSVIFINAKLLILEMHSKTILTFAGLLLSICGWFVWNFALGAIFPNDLNVYQVRGTFIQNFGRTLNYWATMVLLLLTLVSVELFWSAIRRVYFPNDTDIMQRVEKDDEMMRRMEAELDKERGEAEDESRVTKQQQLNDVPAVASTPPMPQHGRRPRNSEEYAGGKWGRPSADYNRQSTVGPVEEEAQGYSPPREMQRMRDRWV